MSNPSPIAIAVGKALLAANTPLTSREIVDAVQGYASTSIRDSLTKDVSAGWLIRSGDWGSYRYWPSFDLRAHITGVAGVEPASVDLAIGDANAPASLGLICTPPDPPPTAAETRTAIESSLDDDIAYTQQDIENQLGAKFPAHLVRSVLGDGVVDGWLVSRYDAEVRARVYSLGNENAAPSLSHAVVEATQAAASKALLQAEERTLVAELDTLTAQLRDVIERVPPESHGRAPVHLNLAFGALCAARYEAAR